MRLTIAILAVLIPVLGCAAPPAPLAVLVTNETTVTWDAVTTDTDGQPIAGITYDVLHCREDLGAASVWTLYRNVVTNRLRLDWPLGSNWCTVVAVSTNGARSEGSNVLFVPVKATAPGRPIARRAEP